jgi:hypothetical protein
MAQASKRRPWVIEMQPPGMDGWFAMGAYSDEKEARMQAELMQGRAREARVRCRNISQPVRIS